MVAIMYLCRRSNVNEGDHEVRGREYFVLPQSQGTVPTGIAYLWLSQPAGLVSGDCVLD